MQGSRCRPASTSTGGRFSLASRTLSLSLLIHVLSCPIDEPYFLTGDIFGSLPDQVDRLALAGSDVLQRP